jgi:hypothetical protein
MVYKYQKYFHFKISQWRPMENLNHQSLYQLSNILFEREYFFLKDISRALKRTWTLDFSLPKNMSYHWIVLLTHFWFSQHWCGIRRHVHEPIKAHANNFCLEAANQITHLKTSFGGNRQTNFIMKFRICTYFFSQF